MKENHINTIICISYFLFFGILFLQFPIHGKLPGNCDTWLAISQANQYVTSLQTLFTETSLGTSMYPSQVMQQAFGESSIGVAIPFIISKLIGLDDIWAYYVLLCFVFALSAFGVFLLCKQYTNSWLASIFGGLAFASSGFSYANIDDPIIVFVFIMTICIYFTNRFLNTEKIKYAYYAGILGSLQVFFSAYLFLFQSLFLVIIIAFAYSRLIQLNWKKAKHLFIATIIYLSLPGLFFFFYINTMTTTKLLNPTKSSMVAELCSLDLGDLLNPLPNNILYDWSKTFTGKSAYELMLETQNYGISFAQGYENEAIIKGEIPKINDELFWISTRRHAFSGFLLLILTIIGLFCKNFKYKWQLLFTFCIGLIIAIGPGTLIKNQFIPFPMYIIYKYIDAAIFFRVPLRAYIICLICMSLLASVGLTYIFKQFGNKKWTITVTTIIFSLIFVLENAPFPMKSFEGQKYTNPPSEFQNYFTDSQVSTINSVILHLPSQMGLANANDDRSLFEFNREFIYMNWQAKHHQHILNGINGYFPKSRLETQKLVNELSTETALHQLIVENNLNYIVFHHDLLLKHEKDISLTLTKSPLLEQLLDTPQVDLYRVK